MAQFLQKELPNICNTRSVNKSHKIGDPVVLKKQEWGWKKSPNAVQRLWKGLIFSHCL